MKVLITGGFGYLGGRLAQFLTGEAGCAVVLGSRRPARSPAWLPRALTVQMRWDRPANIEESCEGIDAIVHLAGMNAQDCAAHPDAALQCNADATSRLLQAAIRQRVQRFIYLSTAHVYGNPLGGVITESRSPAPHHPYATSHLAGEEAVRAASQRGEIAGIVIRLSNSYGPPADSNANCWMLLVNDLCRQAITTRRIALRSSGLQRRDFVPLADVCAAIWHLLNLPRRNPAQNLFNLGGEWAPTVWEMSELVQARCSETQGFEPLLSRVQPGATGIAEQLDYRIDLLRQTGFQPRFDRRGEIDRLLDFCQSSFG